MIDAKNPAANEAKAFSWIETFPLFFYLIYSKIAL
jgi:hypothetical protein